MDLALWRRSSVESLDDHALAEMQNWRNDDEDKVQTLGFAQK